MAKLIPGVDYDVSVCPNCGKGDKHTADELQFCLDSIFDGWPVNDVDDDSDPEALNELDEIAAEPTEDDPFNDEGLHPFV